MYRRPYLGYESAPGAERACAAGELVSQVKGGCEGVQGRLEPRALLDISLLARARHCAVASPRIYEDPPARWARLTLLSFRQGCEVGQGRLGPGTMLDLAWLARLRQEWSERPRGDEDPGPQAGQAQSRDFGQGGQARKTFLEPRALLDVPSTRA